MSLRKRSAALSLLACQHSTIVKIIRPSSCFLGLRSRALLGLRRTFLGMLGILFGALDALLDLFGVLLDLLPRARNKVGEE